MEAFLIINAEKMPEVIHALATRMANLLREAALDEEPRVAERLQEIACAFEIGTILPPERGDSV